jgi:pimeloyl-ACP methyl ester carboxylesterase
MRTTDIKAVGELAGEALAAGGALIRDTHTGIAGRPFGILGPAAAPVRVIHDGVSGAVYRGVGAGLRALAGAGTRVAALQADEAPALESRTYASYGVSALNALWGDRLTTRGNGLALGMGIRRHGAPVSETPEGLVAAFPDATSRLAVFVHGLGETGAAWRFFGRRTYGERLQDELSFTPVFLRYNTGRHVSENGRELARLLEAVVDSWPVRVEDIALIGHSMGGLVARSACHYGGRWTDAVRHVFCLGTPHLGADLEKGANALGWAMSRLPETRGMAQIWNARSAGIKDLRYGACVDEDWLDHDPDEFLRDRCGEVPFLPEASYYFIGATLNPLTGDLLVRMPSASGRGSGRGRRIAFEVDNGHELPGLTHFHLLNHPAVYEQIRTWITRSPEQRSPATIGSPGSS